MLVGLSDMYILCGAETRVEEVARELAAKRSHCAIVMEDKRMVGLVTTKDLALRVIGKSRGTEARGDGTDDSKGDMSVERSTGILVGEIMTREPWGVRHSTSANEALRMMVQRRIRHLPLVEEAGAVVGVLDITACFYQAMLKMERMATDARGLETTVEELRGVADNKGDTDNCSVQHEADDSSIIDKEDIGDYSIVKDIGDYSIVKDISDYSIVKNIGEYLTESKIEGERLTETKDSNEYLIGTKIDEYSFDYIHSRKQKIVNDITSLIGLMKQPDLRSLAAARAPPLYLEARSTIAAAAKQLAAHNTTAALIVHDITATKSTSSVIGILTTKDLTFRVLAMGLNPHTTKIARVMTPKPHFAHESMAIHTALRLMYEGKYLNLPIQCDDHVVGLVNVLHLTRALLRTLESTFIRSTDVDSDLGGSQQDYSQQGVSGPAWDKFWGSLEVPSRISSSLKLHRDAKMPGSNVSLVSLAPPPLAPTTTTTATVKLQLKEIGALNLGVHDKIYRFNVAVPGSSDFNVHAVIMDKLHKRVPVLASKQCDLGYFDKDGDFVSVQRFEDLQLALNQMLVCMVTTTVGSASTIQATGVASYSSPIPTHAVVATPFLDHTLALTGLGLIGLLALVKYLNSK